MSSTKTNKRPFKGKNIIATPNNYTIIDIETTGLYPNYDEIIEIAAIKIRKNSIVDKFSSLVKPNREIDDFITELSGITNDMLADAPLAKDVISDFYTFVSDDVIIGYNVHFDINFLYDYYICYLEKNLSNDFIDLLRFSRRLLPELKNHKLITVANHFNINTEGLHRALKDCNITNECYERFKKIIIDQNIDIKKMSSSKSRVYKKVNANDIVATTTMFDENNYFYKKFCCFTGALERMKRKDAMQLVVNCGGICENGVTKKTNYLILGNLDYCSAIKNGKSAKQKKAESLKLKGQDIEIIPESVFYELLETEL